MDSKATADATASDIPLDPAGRIARDVACLRCGYNLRSLLPDQACPECGAAVAPSLRGDLLRLSDPRWLKRLSAGMTCIVIGQIALLATLCGALRWLELWFSAILKILQPAASIVLILLAFGTLIVGVWLATSPEPGRVGAARDSRTRITIRVLLAAFLLLMLAGALSPVGTSARPATMSDLCWSELRSALCCLLISAGWVIFCVHISPLGRRAGAPRLARFTLLVPFVVGLLGLVCTGISTWKVLYPQQWITRFPGPAITTLLAIPGIAMTLQQVPVVVLAVLYGRVLRREARLARGGVRGSDTTVVASD